VNVPVWAASLAADFWRDVNEADRFPRDLRSSIPRALPLSIFLLADLSLLRIQEWLMENEIVCELGTPDRRLRAGLVAWVGHGIAFVDGRDADDEQRFSLAHELAHFLRDYWRPRSQVESRLGAAALEVVDGWRAATAEERFQSILHFAPMGFRVHLMDRDVDGKPATHAIATAEEDADRLACELLAPAEHVLANVPKWQDRESLQDALVRTYGFPPTQALRYAAILLPPTRHSDPLLLQLKIFT
jgi:hypothetical protein